MGLRDWFRRQPDPTVDLREALFAAAERNDQPVLGELCRQYREEILRQFPIWSTISEATRSDSSALKRYAEGMIAVATEFQATGDPSLMQRLRGSDGDNPVVQGQQALRRADAFIESGDLHEAVSVLESLLSQLDEITGSGQDFLATHALGKLGIAHFHLGDHDRAVAYTRRALTLCEQSGDSEGIQAYQTNLDHILDVQATVTDSRRVEVSRPVAAIKNRSVSNSAFFQTVLQRNSEVRLVFDAHGGD